MMSLRSGGMMFGPDWAGRYNPMYIDIETINSPAKLIGSVGIIGGVLIAEVKASILEQYPDEEVNV